MAGFEGHGWWHGNTGGPPTCCTFSPASMNTLARLPQPADEPAVVSAPRSYVNKFCATKTWKLGGALPGQPREAQEWYHQLAGDLVGAGLEPMAEVPTLYPRPEESRPTGAMLARRTSTTLWRPANSQRKNNGDPCLPIGSGSMPVTPAPGCYATLAPGLERHMGQVVLGHFLGAGWPIWLRSRHWLGLGAAARHYWRHIGLQLVLLQAMRDTTPVVTSVLGDMWFSLAFCGFSSVFCGFSLVFCGFCWVFCGFSLVFCGFWPAFCRRPRCCHRCLHRLWRASRAPAAAHTIGRGSRWASAGCPPQRKTPPRTA